MSQYLYSLFMTTHMSMASLLLLDDKQTRHSRQIQGCQERRMNPLQWDRALAQCPAAGTPCNAHMTSVSQPLSDQVKNALTRDADWQGCQHRSLSNLAFLQTVYSEADLRDLSS